jgi:hypothetical protein
VTTTRASIRIPHDRWLAWYFHQSAAALGETSNWDAMTNASAGGTSWRDPEARITDHRINAARAHRHLAACFTALSTSDRRALRLCYAPRQPVDDERHVARVFGDSFALALETEAAERGFAVARSTWEKPPKTVLAFLARACVGNRDAELAPVFDEVVGAIRAALIDWESRGPGAAGEWITP